MLKKNNRQINFFEKGGMSNNAMFILFIVFLIVIQIGVSFKSENTAVEIRKLEKKIFDLGMKSMSLKTDMMWLYKRSVIENMTKINGLKSSDKLPYIIEKN
ncbi:FtsL-like putative cell division protein [bacterium]|nr:FtsL-like putative cell division protein [bacterium]